MKKLDPDTDDEVEVAQIAAGAVYEITPSGWNSFDVAPDGSWAVIALRERSEADSMLVESFQ
jgi:hypothetical protein